jgi:hypothetical protein
LRRASPALVRSEIWCRLGVFADNLIKIEALAS